MLIRFFGAMMILLSVTNFACADSIQYSCKKWETVELTKKHWKTEYNGFGRVSFQDGIHIQPRSIASEQGTHAALVLSRNEIANDFLIRVRYQNKKSLRMPTANSWEVFWIMFNYKTTMRNKKTNYFILKPTGTELGKAWGEVDQDFLMTDTNYKSANQDDLELSVAKKGNRLIASVRGQVVMDFQGSQKKKLFDQKGQFGLYTEDADVHVSSFEICRTW